MVVNPRMSLQMPRQQNGQAQVHQVEVVLGTLGSMAEAVVMDMTVAFQVSRLLQQQI